MGLEYLAYYAKQTGASENAVVKYALQCLMCVVSCFERFIQFLNKNAYTVTAMTGKSFCDAAAEAFSLMIRNAARFTVAGGIGEMFIVLGRIFICALTGIIGYLIITNTPSIANNLDSPVAPTIVMTIIGYAVGSIFMSVYGAVSDAILIVFTMDEEIEKAAGKNKAANCPEPLKEFIENL